MRNTLCVAAAVCGVFAPAQHGAPGAAHAAQGRASMPVSATIVEVAAVKILRQPAVLTISPEDATRGVVEVRGALHLSLGQRTMWVLEFQRTSGIAAGTRVEGRGVYAPFEGAGTVVLHNGRGAAPSTLVIDYAFRLPPGTRPGIHPWPVALTILPM